VQSRRDVMFIAPRDKIFRKLCRSGMYLSTTRPGLKHFAPTELAICTGSQCYKHCAPMELKNENSTYSTQLLLAWWQLTVRRVICVICG
jgi:hypothetical protein